MNKKRNILIYSLILVNLFACGSLSSSGNYTSNPNTTITPTTVSSTSQTTSNPIDYRDQQYKFEPHLTEKMPKISVTTEDGKNDFATKYNRNDKLAGNIDYVDCKITTSNCDDSHILDNVDCEIKVRGNYTLNYDKKPLRLKFKKKQKMFGLNDDNKFKSWVLLADWKDRSMMNNSTSFFLGHTILGSDGYYTSDYRYVEVELNGQYWGVYVLAEQQQLDEDRIDLTEPEDDYEGTDIGYLLEFDNKYKEEKVELGGDYTFEVNYNNSAKVTKLDQSTYTPSMKGFTIKSDITSTKQVDFISSYMNNLYKIMYKGVNEKKAYVFNEEKTEISERSDISYREAIEEVVDVKSLANMYILSEIACDADVAKSSFYMDVDFSQEKARKLTFEAPWDYDSAYGIKKDICNSGIGAYVANETNPWLSILINEDWFQSIIKEKWTELVEYNVLTNALYYNEVATELYKDYFVSEMTRWPGKKNNSELTSKVNGFKTQKEAADYNHAWLVTRFNYINTLWGDGNELFPPEDF